MDLHVLIKECVDSFGQDIIISKRLIGLLDDKHAFEEPETTAYKKILRGLVNDGYVQRFFDLGKYSSEVAMLASNYAQVNLMQEAPVLYVFDCLAFGLGWVNQEPVMKTTNTGSISHPIPNPQPNNSQKTEEKHSGFFSRLAGLFGSQQKTSLSADDCYQKAIDAKNSNNTKDYLDWLQKAAKKNSAKACLALGSYYSGNNAAQDYEEALKWYKKGVGLGDETCSINLGFMYAYGHGVVADYNKALTCFEAPAKAGNQRAQFGMGYCNYRLMTQLYDKQQTVTVGSLKCYNEAKRWLTYVAEKGNADAQYYLGTLYNLEGFSSESRHELRKKSYEWLDKARKQGHKGANEYINRFGSYYWRS